MKKGQLLQKLQSTEIANQRSLALFGSLIRKEFDNTKNEEYAFELLQLAYKYQVPQLDEMLEDYTIADFNWF